MLNLIELFGKQTNKQKGTREKTRNLNVKFLNGKKLLNISSF